MEGCVTGKLKGRSSNRTLARIAGTFSVCILIFLSIYPIVFPIAYAHEGEEALWLPVHQVGGNLAVSPDPSLSQWSESHHAMVEGLDGVTAEVMSVHNGTYLVLLARRDFSAPLNETGVSIYFNGTVFNSSTDIWGWVGGQNNSTDPTVNSAGSLTGGVLTVVFGRLLVPAAGSAARLDIGVAYDDGIKIASWSNGTAANRLDYGGVVSVGLELLPYIDLYPRIPFVYAAVLLTGAVAFVILEFRRYRP